MGTFHVTCRAVSECPQILFTAVFQNVVTIAPPFHRLTDRCAGAGGACCRPVKIETVVEARPTVVLILEKTRFATVLFPIITIFVIVVTHPHHARSRRTGFRRKIECTWSVA